MRTKRSESEDKAKKKRVELIKRFSVSDDSQLDLKSKMQIELSSYRNEAFSYDPDFDLYKYWKNKSSAFPMLAQLFRVIHCTPATSAEIERVWSLSGLILSSRRSRLESQNYKHLIFVRYNWENTKSCLKT